VAYREISRILGAYLLFFSCALCVPLAVALYFEFLADPATHPQPHSSLSFFFTLLICLALAVLFRWGGRKGTGTLYRREGLMLVVVIWFVTAFIAAIPFTLSGTLRNPLDAYFESMSGLTTTGATVMTAKAYDPATKEEVPIVQRVLTDPETVYRYYGTITPVRDAQSGRVLLTGVEAVSRALLLWRAFIQWIGGMGIVVLFLAVLPALGVGGKVLYQAEVPGPVKEALTPRIKDTAGLLWKLYIALTAAEVLLLYFTNPLVSFFDAVCVSFSNISTGGFSVKNGSIGSYQSSATEWIVIAFMLVGSINFIHYLHILKRKLSRLWEPELLVYFLSLLIGSIIVWYSIVGTPEVATGRIPADHATFTWSEAIRNGTFQLLSCQSSTGFATSDYDRWPFVAQTLLLIVMFIGGMSGSTAGGIKVIRHTMLVRIVTDRIDAIFRPKRVHAIRIGESEVDVDRATTVLSFFFIAISLSVIGTFLLVIDGVDPQTSISTIACMLNNIGIGFRAAGPTGSFAFLPIFGKILSIIWMVMGRLEYFAVLLMLLPGFWRSR
jgi:trk/ktr system potassium uptake protein